MWVSSGPVKKENLYNVKDKGRQVGMTTGSSPGIVERLTK